jgi:D-alanyl-D-alanine carboxypeptidase (penicillin-binding protein 5/6)
MTTRVIGSLLRLNLHKWCVAAVLAGAAAMAFAAPNPVSGPKPADGGFQTAAPHAMLMDAESGTVLFEKGADDLIPPASLSKLMTAEVVFNEIKQGRLKPTTEFIVSTAAWRRGGAPSRTSSMFIPIHSRVQIDDLLHGVIIQSANDACIVLAEGISGTESAFAELMVKRAREIGLTKSTFGNSNGLPDPRQLMTSRELAKLARHIIQTYPEYYKYYGEREFTWNKIRQFNRTPLLAMNIGGDGL